MSKNTMNRALTGLVAGAAVALAVGTVPATAQAPGGARVGTLSCNIAPSVGMVIGGQQQLRCLYTSARGRAREAYDGTISTFGLDIGATSGGQLAWAVLAPTTLRRGALAGSYGGATAGGTIGVGLGANVLLGGSDRTVTLQPLSVQAQTGLNVSAGVSNMELRPAAAAPRRRAS